MESFTEENPYKGENIIQKGIDFNTETDHFQYCKKNLSMIMMGFFFRNPFI